MAGLKENELIYGVDSELMFSKKKFEELTDKEFIEEAKFQGTVYTATEFIEAIHTFEPSQIFRILKDLP